MTQFVLAAESTQIKSRAVFDTQGPLDQRLHDLLALLELVGIPALSTSHQVHAVAGPNHPHFEAALAAYGITYYPPCAEKIVTRTMEMLVAGEILQPDHLEDECLRTMIAVGFATEPDWEERGKAADVVARSYLSQHHVGFDLDPAKLDPARLAACAALASGILVAVSQARAEWRA